MDEPKFTRRQAAIIGAFTGRLAGPFEDLYEYIEKKLGRPVMTHELASKEVAQEVSDAAREDFLALCPSRD